jgi:hypothetical protein
VVSRTNFFFLFLDHEEKQNLFFNKIFIEILNKNIFDDIKKKNNLIIIKKNNFIIIVKLLYFVRSIGYNDVERFAGYLQRFLRKKEHKLYGIICSNMDLSDRAKEVIFDYENIFFSYDDNIVKHLIKVKNILNTR